ncbi:hypothetical protein [Capnocytophaga gingivalis]|uniref:Uncharacterized protein n=1 Tax=Capnocytophaga gingivalis TaxID=1017 RepID=A0ABU5Z7A4_9FLAO|nr:hypothetical protein [Capnocytophaga gingivalis]MEB3074578.1 hypothetical protein [Capnocytophaga gingivalis]
MSTNKDASLFVEKIPANKFFAGKTVEISYKEYQAIKTEDNTVKVGKFLSVDEIHSPFCFGETIDYMVHVIRCSPRSPSLPKEISNMSYHKFLNFSFFRRVENYDKRGLMTSLVLDTYSFKKVLFTFEYDTEERLVQWNCSMFDKIVHSRKFVYYEDGALRSRVRDLCGDTEEWVYDEKGKLLQYTRNWGGNIKTIDGDSYDEEKSEPYIWGTVSYKSFEGKIERTTISEDGEKTVIIYRDIEYQKEPDDFLGSDKYDENVFSCTRYDKKGNEIQKYVRTYFENGSWETVYYQDGIPKRIIRKECNILKDLNYMYTEKFKQVVQYCKENNLFVGYGNPNGKVLVIGKEAAHVAKEDLADHLEKKKEELLQRNVAQWEHILSTAEVPNYDGERPISNENPLYAYGNQFNKKDVRKEGKPYNGGTSSTYLNYEKLYEQLFLQGEKLERINFQKEFFITEFSDYPTKESYKNEDIEALRKQSIEERKPLFALPFFKEFPIVIVAAGDYPDLYHIDLEKTFDVIFKEEIKVGRDRYFLHFSKDNKRILIHTRQLSNSFSRELIPAIASEAKKFL